MGSEMCIRDRSGADVYDRVRQWWETTVLRGGPQFYGKPSMQKMDAIVAVTHGLAMRLILMQVCGSKAEKLLESRGQSWPSSPTPLSLWFAVQLNGWSPTTFHAVWNAGHAHMYVLR